ncbi:hypothetical protein SFRURICE_020716 [Spodoptera frugiperda]|nr:hypothetical protein SFRURICE_020716 [Spodoptera frugiperda]
MKITRELTRIEHSNEQQLGRKPARHDHLAWSEDPPFLRELYSLFPKNNHDLSIIFIRIYLKYLKIQSKRHFLLEHLPHLQHNLRIIHNTYVNGSIIRYQFIPTMH